MKARLYADIHSCNPIATIETEDSYYTNSEEMEWIANILGATWIEYD